MNNRWKKALKYYLSNLILIWLVIWLYRFNPYYVNFLRKDVQATLLGLAILYTGIGFLIHIYSKNPSKGYVLFSFLKRFSKELLSYIKQFPTKHDFETPKIQHDEKIAILFIFVKIFFLPIMINFSFSNYESLVTYVSSLKNGTFGVNYFLYILFPLGLSLIFFIDTLYFSFGYAFEAGFLKNRVKSVEPTFFGWAVALVCYPPFNTLANQYIGWYANDYLELPSKTLTILIRVAILILLSIYLWATLALGTRSSNLTNRGIVTTGPYAFIRHPAYICKPLSWWLTVIPVMNFWAFLSISVWSFIYFLRAITEERHLIKDSDYQEYCKKVKYRFIPFLF